MNTIENDFIEWAEKDRLRSPNTIIKYRHVLDQLREYANPATATVEDLQDWWESRYDMAASTRGTELACLRTFYKYMTAFDHRIDDPTRRLFKPKIAKRLPRMVGRSDFEKLLHEHTEGLPELRLAYALGGYAGLRIAEVAAVDWKDVFIDERRIYIVGKGNKERKVPINTSLMDLILPERKSGNLLRPYGDPYTPNALQRRINRHMKRHGVDHTFHDFRKRGASILLSKGGNPVAVRKMFGWESMETVSSYAEVGDDELDQLGEMLN